MSTYSLLKNPIHKDLQQIALLYREAGWWDDAPQNLPLLARLVDGSHCFIVARRGGRIVGMGRAISDRVSDAYIQDVTVAEADRRRGIGQGLVGAILDHLRSDGLSWIGLIAERGSHGLYEPFGFEHMSNAAPMRLVV